MIRLALLAILAVAAGLFVWSLTRYPAWPPGCVAGAIIAGVAFVMLDCEGKADQ